MKHAMRNFRSSVTLAIEDKYSSLPKRGGWVDLYLFFGGGVRVGGGGCLGISVNTPLNVFSL